MGELVGNNDRGLRAASFRERLEGRSLKGTTTKEGYNMATNQEPKFPVEMIAPEIVALRVVCEASSYSREEIARQIGVSGSCLGNWWEGRNGITSTSLQLVRAYLIKNGHGDLILDRGEVNPNFDGVPTITRNDKQAPLALDSEPAPEHNPTDDYYEAFLSLEKTVAARDARVNALESGVRVAIADGNLSPGIALHLEDLLGG